jgi:hypothetical protein
MTKILGKAEVNMILLQVGRVSESVKCGGEMFGDKDTLREVGR